MFIDVNSALVLGQGDVVFLGIVLNSGLPGPRYSKIFTVVVVIVALD
jgi:hypothetical protein